MDVVGNRAEVDDDAKDYQGDSGNDGMCCGARRSVALCCGELAKEETEAADRKADSHKAKAGANPSEERSLGCKVDSGILFGWLFHGLVARHGGIDGAGPGIDAAGDGLGFIKALLAEPSGDGQ